MSRATGLCLGLVVLICASVAAPAASRNNEIDQLSQEISAAVQSGRQADGLAAANRLEPLIRRQGTRTMNYAAVLHNQGMFLNNLGRYREASDKLEAALSIKLQYRDVASILRTSAILTAALSMQARNADATVVARRALDMGTAAFGADDPKIASSLSALGGLARDREDYQEAEDDFSRALKLIQRMPNPDPNELASALEELGDVYGLEGRFNDGEKLQRQSLQIQEQAYQGAVNAAPNYGKTLNDLGNLLKDAGRFGEAEAVFGRALNWTRQNYGDDHFNVAADLGNLALVMSATSRYAEAEQLNKQSLLIYERTFGPDHPMNEIALNNLATNYLDQGRSAEALALMQRVLSIREHTVSVDSPDMARALGNLANADEMLGRIDEAEALHRRELKILNAKFGEANPQSAVALGSLARVEKKLGRLDDAADKLSRALAIDEKAFGPEHPALIDDLRSLAFLDLDRDQPQQAVPRLRRALAIADDKLGPRHLKTLSTMVNLANTEGRMQQWPEAVDLLRRAASQFADRVNATGRAAADSKPTERLSDIDDELIIALWHVADGRPTHAITEEAFAATQRAEATKVGTALNQMAARFGAGSDAVAALVRTQQDLKVKASALETRISTELGAVDGRRNNALIASLRAEAAQARQSLDEISARIGREFPDYAELANPAPLTLSGAAALLKPDEALISFRILGTQSFVFAVTREASVWQQIPLSAATLNEQVSTLRLGLFDPDPAASPKPFDLDASHRLYEELFAPVASAVGKKTKWLLVPAGAMTSLPPQVLITAPPPPAATPDRYRTSAWLVNDKAITVLPSVSSLRALRGVARKSHATKPFIGFGNPVFQRSGGADRTASRSLAPYQDYYKGATVDLDRLRTGLPALPETADELRAVARALGATDADLRLGPAASVTTVRQTPLTQYRVVEFATHGLVAGEVGGLNEPALVLTLPDRPTEDDNGLLTASNVAKLSLDADWAVLSACNTAAGDRPGAEGLSGLARAFFYAGARALLVSHWPVESDAAVKLTTGAFAELSAHPEIGRAEALRRSMRALIGSSPHNADPSVWAPFVLVGEGG